MVRILKVVQQGNVFNVQSQKSETGTIQKCNIVLQELGGKYEDQYSCSMLGNMASTRYQPGDMVVAALRFSTREYQGVVYQDVIVNEIRSVKP